MTSVRAGTARFATLFIVVTLLAAGLSPAAVLHVSTAGNDTNDGSAWERAKRSVPGALDVAVIGDQIWVAAGTYVGCIDLPPGIALYGGFSGNETELAQRNWATNITALDGNNADAVITIVYPATTDTRVDGFTIQNGSNGGILCNYSSPSICNNRIANNSGSGVRGIQAPGIVSNNLIVSNTASQGKGGGIYSHGGIIVNNTIVGNTAEHGGGIFCYHFSWPPSDGDAFVNNIVAFNSSGIAISFSWPRTEPIVANNCFFNPSGPNFSGLPDPTGTNGNISVDPELVSGGFHIQPGSPCRDAGEDSYAQAAATDVDGQPRIQGDHVDIGVDESDGTFWEEGCGLIVRVSPEGDDANDGSSWSLAKRTVQAGIGAAAVLGGEAWVKAGVYEERIRLLPFARVYGGFAGTEFSRDQRDWNAHVTVLDGHGGTAVTASAGSSCIDGFTIRNGAAVDGGGVRCEQSSPIIRNNRITANSILKVTLEIGPADGAAIYCRNASPLISDNTIEDNQAGGVHLYNSSAIITHNTIRRNETTYGGAIRSESSSDATITDNLITENQASNRGGGIYCSGSLDTIANNTITGNTAYQGGGIYSNASPGTISANTITGNTANTGAGICSVADSSTTTFSYNRIERNTAPYVGGAVHCQDSSASISSNAIVANQTAGLACFNSSPLISNNTILLNSGSGVSNNGASSPTISNNISAFNSHDIENWDGTPSLKNNCFYSPWGLKISGIPNPIGVNGNISADPQFVGVEYGDVHLKAGSPCINAGDGTGISPDDKDLDNEPRIQQGSVDIGADEFNGSQPAAIIPKTIRVAAAGHDSNDGSTWTSAKRTVQAGIDAAAAGGGGDIWVAGSTYNERVTLKLFTHLFGGFAGTETQRAERNWTANPTILDGQAGGSVVTARATSGFCSLDGLTIRNGNANPWGGGVYCDGAYFTLSNSRITANRASYAGGVFCYRSVATLTNNAVIGNTATGGGGVYGYQSRASIVNNTIGWNLGDSACGALCMDETPATIANNVVVFNLSGISIAPSYVVALRNNCVQNLYLDYDRVPDPTGTDGNILADPGFFRQAEPGPDLEWGTADDDYGDLRLLPGSPCIDAGDNGSVPGGILSDLGGLARFHDALDTPDCRYSPGGCGTAPIVDMGAYEYVTIPAVLPADFDRDGDVDVEDFGPLQNCLGVAPLVEPCVPADLDGDTRVDAIDMALFQRCMSGPGMPAEPSCVE